jgi:hypothetical protein
VDRTAIDERAVIRLWESGGFDPAPLQALGLQVVFRGMPSDAGGPDFQDATLSFDNRHLVRGDIEFHVRSSDWVRHGHHRDHNYNNVVLHVVWTDDSTATVRADGVRVPVVALEPHAFLWSRTPPPQGALIGYSCAESLRALPTEEVQLRLRGAALSRFRERADMLAVEIEERSADETAYAALLESMGYASNRETFRSLAEVAPYRWIMSVPPAERRSTLLEVAGLGAGVTGPVSARLPDGAWRLARLRPGNHPAGRIIAIASLLERFTPSLAYGLVDLVFESRRPADVGRALLVHGGSEHLLGLGRAHEVAVSVVLPFAAALEPERDEPKERFLTYPAPPQTRWTRAMLTVLQEAGHQITVRSAPMHQGIHAVYTRHCRTGTRYGCPLCSPPRVA